MSPMKQSFWQSPLTRSSVPKDKVTTPETLLGYLIGPFGALLSSGIFTSYLQVYLGEALGLSSAYLSILQLVSTFLIVAANLIVGQLIERTRTMARLARHGARAPLPRVHPPGRHSAVRNARTAPSRGVAGQREKTPRKQTATGVRFFS